MWVEAWRFQPVLSIDSSALKYLNISTTPGTLATHDYFSSIGHKKHLTFLSFQSHPIRKGPKTALFQPGTDVKPSPGRALLPPAC